MKLMTLLLTAGLAFSLAACGESEESTSAPEPTTETSTGGTLTAMVTCPPSLAMPPRPEGASVDDIIGLRPGMPYDDVMAVLKCREGNLAIETSDKPWVNIQTYGRAMHQMVRASNGEECSSQEILRNMSMGNVCADGGGFFQSRKNVTDELLIQLTGLEGQEVARVIYRSRYYTDADRPTIQSLLDSLIEKYGPYHADTGNQWNQWYFWAYDLNGQKYFQPGKPTSPTQAHIINCGGLARPFQGLPITEECGLSVAVEIVVHRGNELLAQEFHMGLANQMATAAALDSFEAALEAAELKRKQEEAEQAGSRETDL